MIAMNITEALDIISRHRTDEVVIATMTAGQLWGQHSRSSRDFIHAAPMGSAPSIGLGLALGRPDLRVIVLDGDGSLRMNLGVVFTVVDQAPPNFVHFVFENGVYGLSGGHPVSVPKRAHALGAVAAAAGYRKVFEFDDTPSLDAAMEAILADAGPTFVSLRVLPGPETQTILQAVRSPAAQERGGREGWMRLSALINERAAPLA